MIDLIEMGIYELVNNHPPMPVDSLLARLASSHARRTYQRAIAHYLAWIERDPLDADINVLNEYKGELMAFLSPAVVALRLRIVRELYQEACDRGLMSSNPAARLSLPQASAGALREVPSREEAIARLAHCEPGHQRGKRDRALCLLIAEGRVLPTDIPELHVADFHQDPSESSIHLPHRAEGTAEKVSLSSTVAQAIDEYLSAREVADDSPLFATVPVP